MKKTRTKTRSFLQTVIICLCCCLFFLTGCASNDIYYISTDSGSFYNHLLYKFKDYKVYVKSNSKIIILDDIQLTSLVYSEYYVCEDRRNRITKENKKEFEESDEKLYSSNFDETTIKELEIVDTTYYAYSNKYSSYLYVSKYYTLKEEKKVKIKSNGDRYTIIYYDIGYNSYSHIFVEQYEWLTHKIEIPKENLNAIYYRSK